MSDGSLGSNPPVSLPVARSVAERLAGGEGELQLLLHEISYALTQLNAHADRRDPNALATATHAALDSYFRVRRLATVVGLNGEQLTRLQQRLQELGERLGIAGPA